MRANIKEKIKLKIREDDPIRINIFHNTGKIHDLTAAEKDYITGDLSKFISKYKPAKYITKSIFTDPNSLTVSGKKAPIGGCLKVSESCFEYKEFTNNKTSLEILHSGV